MRVSVGHFAFSLCSKSVVFGCGVESNIVERRDVPQNKKMVGAFSNLYDSV